MEIAINYVWHSSGSGMHLPISESIYFAICPFCEDKKIQLSERTNPPLNFKSTYSSSRRRRRVTIKPNRCRGMRGRRWIFRNGVSSLYSFLANTRTGSAISRNSRNAVNDTKISFLRGLTTNRNQSSRVRVRAGPVPSLDTQPLTIEQSPGIQSK